MRSPSRSRAGALAGFVVIGALLSLQTAVFWARASRGDAPWQTVVQLLVIAGASAALGIVVVALSLTAYQSRLRTAASAAGASMFFLARRELATERALGKLEGFDPANGWRGLSYFYGVLIEGREVQIVSLRRKGATTRKMSYTLKRVSVSDIESFGYHISVLGVEIATPPTMIELPLALSSERVWGFWPQNRVQLEDTAHLIRIRNDIA